MTYYVYIMTNRKNGTLYVGVTNNLPRRIGEHRAEVADDFTRRYGIKRLIYMEAHDDIREAIAREKRLKRWKRKWKLELIEQNNPDWRDLFDTLNA